MFKKLHIPVNRSNLKSKYQAVAMAKRMIDTGRSVVFFPEGGIVTKHPPQMMPFKEGAFRTAIEKQIPIVPVSLPYNWIILPDDGKYHLRKHCLRIVIHEPIPTAGLSMENLNELRKQAFAVIENELEQSNYANHQRHHS
jgi:1-acyl-sn-glycerol-3-phosphate acyltransferase